MSEQRWHMWRNMDTTTCPPYGVVNIIVPVYFPPDGQVPSGGIVNIANKYPDLQDENPGNTQPTDNEAFGTHLILHGTRNTYSYFTDDDLTENPYALPTRRGFVSKLAFNNEIEVAPGDVGFLTFSLPAWVAIGGSIVADQDGNPEFDPDNGRYSFASIVTVLNDWKAVCVQQAALLRANTGVMYTLAGNAAAQRSLVGGGITYSLDGEV